MTDMTENPELRVHERGPGAVLAAARAAQNLTLADVARQLKLSVHQVAALEADEFERLPGPVFVRGFVRNYARLLKMDPDRILGMMCDASGADLPTEMPTVRGVPFPTPTARRGPRLLWLALLAVAVLAAYEFYWRDQGLFVAEVEQQAAPVATPAVKEERPATVVPVVATEPAAPAAEPAAPLAPAEVPPHRADTLAAEVVAPQQGDESELRFVFKRESWVQVRDRDGKAIFTRLNPAGSEQRLAGKPPFTLVIGNALGVQLSYKDRAVDLEPHIVREGVARFTLE